MELSRCSVSIRGLTIHYDMAQPVGRLRHRVFVLCAPGSIVDDWQTVLPELTEAGCLCVICEMPGFGRDGIDDHLPIDPALRAKYLWGVLDDIDLNRDDELNRWHLMGHGLACGVIAEMALQQPDSTASLFMVSPVLYSPIPAAFLPLVRSALFEKMIHRWLTANVVSLAGFARLTGKYYGRTLRDRHIARLHEPLVKLVGHEAALRQWLLEGYSVRTEELKTLFLPAMVLWGGRDALLGGQIPDQLRRRDFPSAEYHTLPSAGHYPMTTHSRAVCDFLRGWIREMWN